MLLDASADSDSDSQVDNQTFNAAAPPRIVSGTTPQKKKAKAKAAANALPPTAGPILTPQQMAAQSGIPGLGGYANKRRLSSLNSSDGAAARVAAADDEKDGPTSKKVKVVKLENGQAPQEPEEPGEIVDSPAQTTSFDAFAPHPSLNAPRNFVSAPVALRGRGGHQTNGRGNGRGAGAGRGIGRGAGRGGPANGAGRGAPGVNGISRGGAPANRGTPILPPGQAPAAGPRPKAAPSLFIQKKVRRLRPLRSFYR